MNLITGPIDNIAELGSRVRVTIGPISAEITADSLHRLGLRARPHRLRLVQGDRHAYRRQRQSERGGDEMKLSTRNQLSGKVTDIKLGTIMSEITVDVGGQTSCRRSRAAAPSTSSWPSATTSSC